MYDLTSVLLVFNFKDTLLQTTGEDGVSLTFAQLVLAIATVPDKAVEVPSSSSKVKRFVKDWFTLSPSEQAEFAKIRAASQLGVSSTGLGKFKKGEFDLAKGGMVRSYSTGGSVSRGQYASQPKKVKFKGVF